MRVKKCIRKAPQTPLELMREFIASSPENRRVAVALMKDELARRKEKTKMLEKEHD